ncbi:MAG: hypothetical protein IPN53_07575 [Comamonadaceae bacterium]|nr:hypothetical protein [Comamonadaceae bacterium]
MTERKAQRWIQEARDILELVLLPGMAAVLPWTLCFMLFKRFARWRWLYREPCEAALAQATRLGWGGEDQAHWLWVRKLVTLVDHADHYLGLSRSDRWMQRHLQVTGRWPAGSKGMLLITFHWGAGYWGLRHATAQGLHPHALVASLSTPAYQGRWVLTRYARSRNAHVANTLGAEVLDVRKNLKAVILAARRGSQLLAVVDAPADDTKTAVTVKLMGMTAQFPIGMLRLAVDQQLSAVMYVTGLNVQTGTRTLSIQALPMHLTAEELAGRVFGELQALITQDAPAWHFWSEAPRIFR